MPIPVPKPAKSAFRAMPKYTLKLWSSIVVVIFDLMGLGRKAMFGTQEFPAPLPSPKEV